MKHWVSIGFVQETEQLVELGRIVAATRAGDDRFSALLDAVVTSPLFIMRDPDLVR